LTTGAWAEAAHLGWVLHHSAHATHLGEAATTLISLKEEDTPVYP
jgi:hypothetical protein